MEPRSVGALVAVECVGTVCHPSHNVGLRRSRLAGMACILAMTSLPLQRARAQHAPASFATPSSERGVATLPDSVVTITIDTGAFAPGHRDFTRYTTPGLCLAAAQETRDVLRRTLPAQRTLLIARETLARDTIPTAVTTIARACGARFTVAGTAPRELPALFALALLERNDTLARAVADRRAKLEAGGPTGATLPGLLTNTVGEYLRADPPQPTAAESLVARIDAMGRSALVPRLQAHAQLLQFATSHVDLVDMRQRMRQEADRIITLGQALTPAELVQLRGETWWGGPVTAAYRALMMLALLEYPDSMPVIARRAQQDLGRTPDGPALTMGKNPFRDASVQRMTSILRPGASEWGHTVTPRLQAAYWFPNGVDTLQPKRGTVSLFIRVRPECYVGDGVPYPWFLADAESCGWLYDYIRHWAAMYGASGLAITLVTEMRGAALQLGAQTPADGARAIAWFLLDGLKLPVSVAVQNVSLLKQLPSPDDRRYYDLTPFEHGYDLFGVQDYVVLTGRDGTMLYRGDYGPALFAQPRMLFDALLAQAVLGTHTPTAPAVTPSATPSHTAASAVLSAQPRHP